MQALRYLLERSAPLGGVLALLLAWSLPLAAKEKEGKKKDFSVPVPIGHKVEGLKLPDHDEEGLLRMNFEIGTAERISEETLEMVDLTIELYDKGGKSEMMIELAHSLLDLKTRILSSEKPVVIRRTNMELTGENMTFNTETREGRLVGPVRMLIFDHDEFATPKKEKTSSQ